MLSQDECSKAERGSTTNEKNMLHLDPKEHKQGKVEKNDVKRQGNIHKKWLFQ